MKYLLKWLPVAIALGVAIFLIFFLVAINSQDVVQESEPLEVQKTKTTTKPQKTWLNHFSQSQRKGYFYPVNEIYIKLDLNEKITKTITYKLTAKVKDPYQLFCLQEELKRHNLKYYMKKDAQGLDLLIYSKDVQKLNKLTQVLKNYKIHASIKRYKEEY